MSTCSEQTDRCVRGYGGEEREKKLGIEESSSVEFSHKIYNYVTFPKGDLVL